ncbi:hypothetical protein HAX54_040280, partial [Datura stramonium]|nr:hypothetical protein [Datura stramonium]
MNAQEHEVVRLQQLANAQASDNNQHDSYNDNDDVSRDELNEQNIEDVALENHRHRHRAKGQ